MDGELALRLATRPRAKINATLAVLGRRPDGFHDLDSIFLRLRLADELTVATIPGEPPTTDAAADVLTVHDAPDCPVADNLVLRAAALLRAHEVHPLPPLAWVLHKRIPLAAGLGGGSADAAAALELAALAWSRGMTPGERVGLAAELGSDVPFFAADVSAARVTGRGEQVTPLPRPTSNTGLVLVTPPWALPTRDVFAAYAAAADRLRGPSPAGVATARLAERLEGGLSGAALADLADELQAANDLWVAACAVRPGLAALRGALERRLRRPALLSGSGPTLVALYPSEEAAEDAAVELALAVDVLPEGTRVLATGVA
ncbi:MAG: 4-(cytidine 5'-diphospho)-2-C-methyl-D-erythritol kinase [Candidatus Limnocylindrales bacterium]